MKKLFSLLLLLTVAFSCIKKEEVKSVEKKGDPLVASVGKESNGKYIFTDSDSLVYKWNVFVNKKMKPQDSIILNDFSIIKSKTKGERTEDCYLLVAKDRDHKVSLGAILNVKDKKFYTKPEGASSQDIYEVILCNGGCNDVICSPDVIVAGGVKRLICSACDQCVKVSGSIK